MKVGIICIQHESSTFNPVPTTLADFERGIFLVGEDIRQKYSSAHHEVTGFFEGLAAAAIEAVPLVMFSAGPAGVIAVEAWDEVWRLTCAQLEKAGPLDGILAAPHGAAVGADGRWDLDGWWLAELRQRVGPRVPIVATLDPHANLSPAMAEACDALVAYRENPHVDQRERGREAADLLVKALRENVRLTTRVSFPAIAINIEAQGTREEPMLSVIRQLEIVRSIHGVLSASVIMGFPYADVAEMGSSFVVVTNGDEPLASVLARELGDWLWRQRERFRGKLIAPETAVAATIAAPRPIGLLDMGDNMGGGAPADSTFLARLFHEAKRGDRVFVCLCDPESESQARQAGPGKRVTLSMGGKAPGTPAPPLDAEVQVISVHDGRYSEREARHGGQTEFDMGPTSIVRTDTHLTVMLTARRAFPSSLEQLHACGLNPTDFDVLIIKGVHAPIAAYAAVCPTLIRVNTPGVTTADLVEALHFERRRHPLFPFEELPSQQT